jgi:uncharacterized protein (TIGR03118 family)
MVAKQSLIGAAAAVLLAGVAFAGPAGAGTTGAHAAPRADRFQQKNLVSDQPGVAAITDPDLVNAWGISHGPNTPVWISDNGANVTTLYQGGAGKTPVSKVPLTVSIPGGAPTGQVFNSTSSFRVPGTKKPALFIFASELGSLSAWNLSTSPGTAAVRVARTPHAVYKGLAMVQGSKGPRLLATNFHANRIDVFNGHFHRVRTHGAFRDRSLPAHYAPFNVAAIGHRVFVTYARQDSARHDDVAGRGHGFVDVYTDKGALMKRFASRGVLNSPWALTKAPKGFGRVTGDLLIGNFGNGRIHAFNPRTGKMIETLRGTSGRPLKIDGLWALFPGDRAAGGTHSLWFSAGPNGEAHGLLGLLTLAR